MAGGIDGGTLENKGIRPLVPIDPLPSRNEDPIDANKDDPPDPVDGGQLDRHAIRHPIATLNR